MKRASLSIMCLTAVLALGTIGSPSRAEILALVNYETKPEQTIRREGIAVVDVDPASDQFGKILMDMPLPPDLGAHHIFYNKDTTKAYVTALRKPELRVIDLTKNPYRMKTVAVEGCGFGEDIVFSDDNKTWYLTCMGTDNVIVGDATTDTVKRTIPTPKPYPHGIAINGKLDRMLVTSTVRPADLGDPGETVSELELSTGKIIASHKVSNKPSPAGEAPVEILFLPKSDPPLAYVTNLFGGSLWAGTWSADKNKFDFAQAVDVTKFGAGVPLEIYFNKALDRLYLTTASPGQFHIFDIAANPRAPKLVKTIDTAAGAHHVGITPDERYAIVQNNLLGLPGMGDGSITVIDLIKGETVASMDTFKNQGLNPNLIVLLPEWYNSAGH